MSSTGTAKSSMQRRALAMFVAGALLLGASGPTLAASPLDSNVSGSDVITLGAKLGIAGGTSIAGDGTVVALGFQLSLSGGSSNLAPSGEEIPQRV
jgi:hypothetical protein